MLCLAHTAQAQIVFSTFKFKPTLLYYVKSLHLGFICKGEKQVKYVKIEWCAVNEIGVEKVHAMPVNICIEYMDGTDWEKDINKDNYQEFFPQLKWINITVPGE